MPNENGKTGNRQGANHEDYDYDVFLSYTFRDDVVSWIDEKFEPNFKDPLDDELIQLGLATPPPKGRVCLARRNIVAGDIWPEELRQQLQRSKVLVAICSPKYFTSAWCLSEWKTFQQRASSLIVPVLFSGETEFLERNLESIQYEDFRTFRKIPGARAHLFSARVEKLARIVAKKVLNAPAYGGLSPIISRPANANVELKSL